MEPSDYPLSSDPKLEQLSAAVYVGIHSLVWLGCFIVAAAITQVSRQAIVDSALPLDPMSLQYLRFANAVADVPPIALLGAALVLMALDYALLRSLSRQSPGSVVARAVWTTFMTALPFAALAWALIALDMPFRGVTISRSKVLNQHFEVENQVRAELMGTWVATSVSRTGEPATTLSDPLTLKFSSVTAAFPDVKLESSNSAIILSGKAFIEYHGSGVCLHVFDGNTKPLSQVCVLPREPGNEMILWATTAGNRSDAHRPTERVTVITLERKGQH